MSIQHLKQIGLALHNYVSAFVQFPPAVVYGPDGQPWHSWRVLILPFLEHQQLYNDYDFSQPWNSEKNHKLLENLPDVYRDPVYGDTKESYTHYAALVGPQAVIPPEGAHQIDPKVVPLDKGGSPIRRFTDGTSFTVAVSSVEPGRRIPWTKPEDIDVGPQFVGLGKPAGLPRPSRRASPAARLHCFCSPTAR